MSLLAIFKGKGPSGFGYGSTGEDVTKGLDLGGRTILLTGCNSGIGKESLRVFAKRGVRVIAAARTVLGRTMGSPSWRTCSSPTSWRSAWRVLARPRIACTQA
jgi:hypothetical protein